MSSLTLINKTKKSNWAIPRGPVFPPCLCPIHTHTAQHKKTYTHIHLTSHTHHSSTQPAQPVQGKSLAASPPCSSLPHTYSQTKHTNTHLQRPSKLHHRLRPPKHTHTLHHTPALTRPPPHTHTTTIHLPRLPCMHAPTPTHPKNKTKNHRNKDEPMKKKSFSSAPSFFFK